MKRDNTKIAARRKSGSLKKTVVSGVLWKTFENFSIQFINLFVSIVLARLLEPKDFGTVALLTIFISIASILMSSGFPTALIQKKDVDQLDYCSVFYFNICIGLFLYGVLWLASPGIATFYRMPVLRPIMRVVALRLVLGSLSAIQKVQLSRDMLFRKSFMISLPGVFARGLVGTLLAYHGYGVWSLVYGELVGSLVSTALRWIVIGWRPSLQFSFSRLRTMFSFGSKLMGSSFVTIIASQLHSLVIGRFYSPSDLGFYNRGDHLPMVSMRAIEGSVETVLFPALTKVQDDIGKLKQSLRRTLRTTTFLLFPLLFGIAAVAEPLVRFLLSEKWMPSIPYVRLACLIYVFTPIGSANLQAVKAIGQSGALLRIQIAKRVLAILMIFVTFRFGVFAMALGRLAIAPFELMLNIRPNAKFIGYSFWEMLMDIFPNFLLAAVMALIVYSLSFLASIPDAGMLILHALAGIVLYFGAAFALKFDGLSELRNILKR